MKFSTKELVIMAAFGALWGVTEITLGSVIKGLRIPMGGVILGCVGLLFALIGRGFVPRKGSIIFIGFVAMVLKLFSIGNIILGPMVGIISEAIIAELVLSITGQYRISYMLAVGLSAVWTLVQPFITGTILYGANITEIWMGLITKAAAMFNLDPDFVWGVLVLLLVGHLLIGAIFGWIAWDLKERLHERLGVGQTPAQYH